MSEHKFLSVFLLYFILVFVSAVNAPAQGQVQENETAATTEAARQEIDALIADALVDTQKGAIFGYTYFMKFSFDHKRSFGSGRRFTRLYEAIIPSRFTLRKVYSHPFVLIRDSEKEITGEDIAKQRRQLADELERAETEAESDPNPSTEQKDGGYWTMRFSSNGKGVNVNILKLLENSDFANLQRRQIEGRNIFSIDFIPSASAKFETALAYLNKIEGRIWIDEADKRIVRIEGFPGGKFAEFKDKPDAERAPQTVFLFAQKRVAEGFWFPETVVLNFTKTPEIFETVRVEFDFTDYRKSGIEIRTPDIAPPKEIESNDK